MINRVTENMKFNTLTGSLFNVQGKAAELMEKISTRKNINRPSDDPIGAGKVLNYTSIQASITQYQTNITNAKAWLSLTDTNLEGIKNIVAQAKSIANGATEDTMDANASTVSSLIDDALSLMNAKSGDSYIFGGSKTDVAPFSTTSATANIGNATKATNTTFKGTVVSGGNYTGADNKSYKVKIITGGTLAQATYQVSDDGGKTWGERLGPAYIGNATKETGTSFKGTVVSGGNYTGTEDKSYEVKIITGGTLAQATYQVSDDGGNTWLPTSTPPGLPPGGNTGTITLGNEGVTMTFTPAGGPPPDVFVAGDLFSVKANAASTLTSTLSTGTINLGNGVTMTFTPVIGDAFAADDLFSVSATPAATSIGAASAANNIFDGKVVSSGTYTGTANKTYAVKIINGGTPPLFANASYQISTDGGKNWSKTYDPTSTPPSTLNTGIITLGDGVTMTFTAGTQPLTANDLFTVNGYSGGYYRGNDDELIMQVGKSNNFAYNITGAEAFTAVNSPVASASVSGGGAGLTADDNITLTQGDTVGSWTLTSNAKYPNMKITSVSDTTVTIDADGAGGVDITLSLSGGWQKGNTASFSIIAKPSPTVSDVTISGPGSVDLLETLNTLESALEAHDETAVSAQADNLNNVQTQVLQAQTKAGAKASSLTDSSTRLTSLNEQITSLKSEIDDIDLAKLIVSYQLEQTAMEASYNMAA
ncbi:MAG: hypothetical protein ABFD50_06235, partial [Smithella sp.]